MVDEPQSASRSDERFWLLAKRLVRSLPRLEEIPTLREAITRVQDDDAILLAIRDCVTTLRAASARLRTVEAPAAPAPEIPPSAPTESTHGTEPLPAFGFHERPTMALPAMGDAEPRPAPTPPHPVTAEPQVRWSETERMLYEDIVTLFELGDQVGAMISIERLLMLSPKARDLDVFLERNESVVRKVYEEHFGSLDRIPVPLRDAHPIRIPTNEPATILNILRLVDGQRTIRDIVHRSKDGQVRVLITIAHLARSGFIEVA